MGSINLSVFKIHPEKLGNSPLLHSDKLRHFVDPHVPLHQMGIGFVKYLVAVHEVDDPLLLVIEHKLPGPWLLDFGNAFGLKLVNFVDLFILAAFVQ